MTGLMVFDRPQQNVAARSSIACFFSQNWPCKELVIYNTTCQRLIPWWKHRRRALEIRLKLRLPGQMLGLCAENANGEWLMNWMPDCWYDPNYISTLMQHRQKNRLVLLRNKHVYGLKDRKTLIVSDDSVLCWNMYRHFPVNFETPIIEQFTELEALNNPAHLIVKFAREIV